MEWTALLVIGLVVVVVLVIVALRGSFRSDDDFYGATPVPPITGTSDERGADHEQDQGPFHQPTSRIEMS